MSAYRTISSSDLCVQDRVKLSLRACDAATDDGLFYVSSNGSNTSVVSDVSYDGLGLESAGASQETPSVCELQTEIPALFRENQSIEQVFMVEEFVAHNITEIGETFSNREFGFDENMVLHPLDSSRLMRMGITQQDEMLDTLKSLEASAKQLREVIANFNGELMRDYQSTISTLRLSIFSNFRLYKKTENSRVMFHALKHIRYILKSLVTDKFSREIHEIVNSIIDGLYDFNQLAEMCDIRCRNSLDSTTNHYQDSRHEEIKQLMNEIESTLNKESPFIKEECSVFMKTMEQIKICFGDYISRFRSMSSLSPFDKYPYEIISLDDHIKSHKKTDFVKL